MSADLSRDLERLLADADIWRARILMTAAELDVFTAIAGGACEPAALADRLGADPRATARLLCALHEMGYLVREGDEYRNAPIAAHFLVKGSPYYLGSWLVLHALDWPAWGGLTEAIVRGRPPAPGSIFADPQRLAVLLHAAHDRARLFHIQPLLAAIDLRGVHSLLDVGGGAGTYALAFCETYPELRCTLFDLPAAIDVAREVLAPFPAAARIALQAGDFTRDELGGPFDAALLSNVLHGEAPAAAAALLARIRRALRPGGRLVIRDTFLGDDGTNAMGGAVFGMTLMIETTAGRTHRLADVEAMLRAAGFDRTERPGEPLLVAYTPAV